MIIIIYIFFNSNINGKWFLIYIIAYSKYDEIKQKHMQRLQNKPMQI